MHLYTCIHSKHIKFGFIKKLVKLHACSPIPDNTLYNPRLCLMHNLESFFTHKEIIQLLIRGESFLTHVKVQNKLTTES